MTATRREFLRATGAAVGCAMLPRAVAANETPLRAGIHRVQLAPAGYPTTEVWAYDGLIPGPEIRLPQGSRVRRDFVNDLPQATTIHWHGIRIENAMDGVPGMTQAAVPPGGRFLYDFSTPDAGTYWYHTHNRTVEQMARGLAGPLIVTEAEPPEVDAEHVVFLSDWRMTDPADLTDDFANFHDLSHAGRIGNHVTANGLPELTLPVARGDRLRLRLVNAAPSRVFELALQGLDGWIVALDGMPLAQPRPAADLVMAPAQRVDLIVDVVADQGEDAFLLEVFRGQGYALATFPVARTGGQARRGTPPAALPPNPGQKTMRTPDRPPVDLVMDGGAMRGLRSAVWQGRQTDGRSLAQEGQFWALNGIVGLPDDPLLVAERGETLRVPLINRTAFPHGMHLHGHHFREVLADGTHGDWRDTILVAPGETTTIDFLADNPGDWLVHCHMLSHHAAGMGTWIRVLA